jgi:hypothetical protein
MDSKIFDNLWVGGVLMSPMGGVWGGVREEC